jgi:cytochrome c556
LAAPADARFNLRLTPAEQSQFLAEMRVMLGSVQGIVQGIAESDREAIANFARISGNRMARATPASVRAKLPPAFQELGGPTHLMFEELGLRAETDDMDQLAALLGRTLHQCMACHAAFRIR